MTGMELTAADSKRLKILEDIIEHSKGTAERHWMEIGKALTEIREKKLYIESNQTFEQYCLQRWGFKRARAYQLVKAVEIMSTMVDKPESERHTRALANIPEKQRTKVYRAAKKSGRVTGKSIKDAAVTIVTDVIEKDKTGRDIPGPAMAVWNRRNELRPKMRPLYELKQWAQDMQGTNDILFRGFDFGALARQVGQVIHTMLQAVPDVVCTQCQGQAPDTCTFCKGRGMISMAKAKAYTPVEMKNIIDKQISKNDTAERLSGTGR